VLLRLAKQHQCANPQADDSQTDCRADTAVNILAVADLAVSEGAAKWVNALEVNDYCISMDAGQASYARQK
jgi:hypothetical protein